jgi:hypothetical protein
MQCATTVQAQRLATAASKGSLFTQQLGPSGMCISGGACTGLHGPLHRTNACHFAALAPAALLASAETGQPLTFDHFKAMRCRYKACYTFWST